MSAAQSQMIQTEKQNVYTYVLQIERGRRERRKERGEQDKANVIKC